MVISHLKELIEIVANSSGGYSTTKDVSASITMGHVVGLLSAESMSWSSVVHEDEIRHVLSCRGLDYDWVNDVIQVAVWGSSVLSRHTCPHHNTTKGSSGDNSG